MAGYVLSAAAVAKLRRALAPKAGSSSRPGAGASPVASDNFSAPFAVRWSASEASGAWVMWLPDKAKCVSVAGAYVTPTGITAADDLPAGWYTIDNAAAQSTALYLVLTTDDSTGATTAEIDTAAGTASTGETVTNILIASLATDSQTGAKRVRQFVVGTLALTPGGEETPEEVEPDGVSINKVPEAPPGAKPDGNEGKMQIKDWKAGSNAATQSRNFSLAEVLTFGPEADLSRGDKMVVRGDPTRNGGAVDLAYRAVGQLPFDGVSIEGTYVNNYPKIQIKDFDTAAATEVTLSSTATADKFLVKSVGGNVEYRTLKAPAGGGGGADISALNGVTLVTNVEWIGSPTYAIRVTKRTCTVANNVLTLGSAQTTDIQTTPLSQEANAS